MRLTSKQMLILNVILRGNEDGSFVDMDQLVEGLPYETTKQSLQYSIRHLANRGLAEKRGREKRRGRSRLILAPTALAYAALRGSATSNDKRWLKELAQA